MPSMPASFGSPPKEPGNKPTKIEWEAILRAKLTFLPILVGIFVLVITKNSFCLLLLIIYISFLIFKQVQDYSVRLQNWEAKRKDFQYLKSDYQYQEAQSEQRKSKNFTQKEIEDYRKQQILKALAQTLPYDGTGSQARKGGSETMFNQYLNRYFPGKIYTGLTLTILGFQHSYSPDFTYIDKSLNLYIDIEIDEPYVFHTGEPTHFKECQKDKRRNEFFLGKNWIVIRFAEEQVYKHPKECYKFVAAVALKCGIPMPESLQNVATLPAVCHWTEAEAREMVANKTRDSYKSSYSVDCN